MSTDTTIPADMMEAAKAVWGDDSVTEAPAEASEASPELAKADEQAKKPVSAEIAAKKRAQSALDKRRIDAESRDRELKAREAAIAAKAKEVEDRDQLLRLMEEDPAKYFEVKKLGAKGIQAHLERLANGLKPEEVQEKRQSALETEMERLKGEIARRDEEAANQRRSAEQQTIAKEAEAHFVAHIEENADQYPHLIEEFSSKEAALKAGYELLHRVVAHDAQGRKITELTAFVAKHGREPTNEQICKFLDLVAKERIEGRQNNAWRARNGNPPDTGSRPSAEMKPSPSAALGNKPRTLSARDTSQRSTARGAAKTDEEIDAESLALLQKAWR